MVLEHETASYDLSIFPTAQIPWASLLSERLTVVFRIVRYSSCGF